MKRKFKASGFTLIEMLVVIAIITILAAILLPVIKGVKISAQIAKSTNNAKRISEGILAYAQHDNDWFLPGVGEFGLGGAVPNVVNSTSLIPAGLLNPYVDSAKLWESPLDRGTTGGGPVGSTSPTCFTEKGSSYAYAASDAGGIKGVNNGSGSGQGDKMTTFMASTKKIIVYEANFQNNDNVSGAVAKQDNWHGKRKLQAVCGFLDGHAGKVSAAHSSPPSNTEVSGLVGLDYY